MVWLALVFVGLMALALPHGLIALPDEVGGATPALAEPVAEAGSANLWLNLHPFERATLVNNLAVAALVLLAIPFWLELLLRLIFVERAPPGQCRVPGPSRGRIVYMICCALVPPLRTGLPPATLRGYMWLPGFGWRHTSGPLSRRVQRAFGFPMLAIGLLILPVLVGEIFLKEQVRTNAGLAFGLDAATRLIWFAFALEFTVMMAVTPRKMEYAFRHWVDLVIILLPFVAFLRTLQVLRAGQILKAQRMSQLARTYRLRGVAVKLLQAVLMLRVLEGLSERAAKRRIENLNEQIRRRRTEVRELQQELRQSRRELALRLRRRRAVSGQKWRVNGPLNTGALPPHPGDPASALEG